MVKQTAGAAFKLCPQCGRALLLTCEEQFCSNDGTPLIQACPNCQASILSPYARYCARCGQALTQSGRNG